MVYIDITRIQYFNGLHIFKFQKIISTGADLRFFRNIKNFYRREVCPQMGKIIAFF